MTQHLRTQLARLTTNVTRTHNTWPDPWPERLQTHTDTLNRYHASAITNLALAAHTPPEHDPATTPTRHQGDTKPSPVEAAASRQAGPARVINQLETHIITANSHILIGHGSSTTHQHDRGRAAWTELGQACTIVERWQQLDRTERERLACNGYGMPGFFIWGNEDCGQIAAPDLAGLCIDCHRHRETWRVTDWRERKKQGIHA